MQSIEGMHCLLRPRWTVRGGSRDPAGLPAAPEPAPGRTAMTPVYRRLEGRGAPLAILHAAPHGLREPALVGGLLIASHGLVIVTVDALQAAE